MEPPAASKHRRRRFLQLEEGDGSKLALFALLGLLMQAGLTMGMNGADSVFLVLAGADKLPRIYLAMPAIMLVYIPIYSALMSRWGLDRVFDATLGLLVAGGLGFWLALTHAGGLALPFCYAAKLYAAVWYVGLYTLYWNFVDGYFDLYEAKRLFAMLAAGSALGAILGGCLVGPITSRLGVPVLFLCWALCSAAAWPVAVWTRRRWPKLESDEDAAEDLPALKEMAGIGVRLLRTRYPLVLTLVLFFTLIAATVCEFQYLGIFSAGRNEAALAALLGRLMATANLFNLGVSLFVFNRLVAKIGVRNVALLQSAAYSLVFCWLLLDGGFPAAAAGFFAYQGLMTSVDFNNINLLFSGLPADRGKEMRTLIEGIGEPLAVAAAGLFLLIDAPRLSPEEISITGAMVALIAVGLVFILRHDYTAAIGANLRRGWLDLSEPAEPLLRAATPADIERAEARVLDAAPGEAAVALRVLWLNDPPRAVRGLLAFLGRVPEQSRAPVKPLLDEVLARPDSQAAQEIQRWLDRHDSTADPELAGEFGRRQLLPARQTEALLQMREPEAQGAAAAALWQSWRVPDGRQALGHIEELLAADDERSVLAGLRALGRLGEPRYAYRLRDFLRSASPPVRKTALAALRTLADSSSAVLLPEVLAALAETTDQERLFALEAFERIGDSATLATLLAAAESFTPAERRRTERLILHLGQGAVPILTKIVQEPRFVMAGRSVALRALGKLALPQMRLLATPLVEQLAQRSYLFLNGYLVLSTAMQGQAEEAGHAVLIRICREFPSLAMELILETLAVAGRLPNYEALAAALRSSHSKDRGYAIETIEQACPPSTFAMLLPLLDGRPIEAQVAFASARDLVFELGPEDILCQALEYGSPLAAAAAAQALLAGGGEDAAERALARLCQSPHPLLSETVVQFLARRADGSAALTPVERVRSFMAAPDFAGCRYPHHEFLAPHVLELALPRGAVLCRRGEELAGLWLVLAGTARVEGAAGPLGPGAVVAAELLRGARTVPATLVAETELQALFLPAGALRRCAEVFPELALALLAQKLAA